MELEDQFLADLNAVVSTFRKDRSAFVFRETYAIFFNYLTRNTIGRNVRSHSACCQALKCRHSFSSSSLFRCVLCLYFLSSLQHQHHFKIPFPIFCLPSYSPSPSLALALRILTQFHSERSYCVIIHCL